MDKITKYRKKVFMEHNYSDEEIEKYCSFYVMYLIFMKRSCLTYKTFDSIPDNSLLLDKVKWLYDFVNNRFDELNFLSQETPAWNYIFYLFPCYLLPENRPSDFYEWEKLQYSQLEIIKDYVMGIRSMEDRRERYGAQLHSVIKATSFMRIAYLSIFPDDIIILSPNTILHMDEALDKISFFVSKDDEERTAQALRLMNEIDDNLKYYKKEIKLRYKNAPLENFGIFDEEELYYLYIAEINDISDKSKMVKKLELAIPSFRKKVIYSIIYKLHKIGLLY